MEENKLVINAIDCLEIPANSQVLWVGDLPREIEVYGLEKEINFTKQSLGEVRMVSQESYDFVIVYGEKIGKEAFQELLTQRKKDGRLVLLANNKFAASFLLEDKEAYSYYEILALIEGGEEYTLYYPYPSFQRMQSLFSEKRLPEDSDLEKDIYDLECDRYLSYPEAKMMKEAVKDGMFSFVTNSYMLVVGTSYPTTYIRYSNERAKEYQIKTSIVEKDGIKEVKKKALTREAKKHVQRMADSFSLLKASYDREDFNFATCVMEGDDSVNFAFVSGVSLAKRMNDLVMKKDEAGISCLFLEFLNKLENKLKIQRECSNLDFIFSNILIQDRTWNVVDYEWVVEKELSAKELAFRAAYCFSLEQKDFPLNLIIEQLELSREEVAQYINAELEFQSLVTKGNKSYELKSYELGRRVYHKEDIERAFLLKQAERRVQVYYDTGRGFSEEESEIFCQNLVSSNQMNLKITVPQDVIQLRVDPCEEACVVKVTELRWNGIPISKGNDISINGKKANGVYIFETADPNIKINLQKEAKEQVNTLELAFDIFFVGEETAQNLSKNLRKIW